MLEEGNLSGYFFHLLCKATITNTISETYYIFVMIISFEIVIVILPCANFFLQEQP